MNPTDLEQNPRLVVMIEAASDCESRNKRFIRYGELRTRSNQGMNTIIRNRKSVFGRGMNSISGDTFASIIRTLSNPSIPKKKRYLTRRKVKVRGIEESRIYPNITLIQKEIKARQEENLESGKKFLTSRYPFDPYPRARSPKRRESIQVSEKLAGVVTYADKRKRTKII